MAATQRRRHLASPALKPSCGIGCRTGCRQAVGRLSTGATLTGAAQPWLVLRWQSSGGAHTSLLISSSPSASSTCSFSVRLSASTAAVATASASEGASARAPAPDPWSARRVCSSCRSALTSCARASVGRCFATSATDPPASAKPCSSCASCSALSRDPSCVRSLICSRCIATLVQSASCARNPRVRTAAAASVSMDGRDASGLACPRGRIRRLGDCTSFSERGLTAGVLLPHSWPRRARTSGTSSPYFLAASSLNAAASPGLQHSSNSLRHQLRNESSDSGARVFEPTGCPSRTSLLTPRSSAASPASAPPSRRMGGTSTLRSRPGRSGIDGGTFAATILLMRCARTALSSSRFWSSVAPTRGICKRVASAVVSGSPSRRSQCRLGSPQPQDIVSTPETSFPNPTRPQAQSAGGQTRCSPPRARASMGTRRCMPHGVPTNLAI